jgi:hypothetical protein
MKRGMRGLTAGLLLLLLILASMVGHLMALHGPTRSDASGSQARITSTTTPLIRSEMDVLRQYNAWISSQPNAPPHGPGQLDPSTRAALRECAQAIDASYRLLPLPDGRLALLAPGATVTATLAAHSNVDDPCLLYLAHELLFGAPAPLHHPQGAPGIAVPSTAQPGLRTDPQQD